MTNKKEYDRIYNIGYDNATRELNDKFEKMIDEKIRYLGKYRGTFKRANFIMMLGELKSSLLKEKK